MKTSDLEKLLGLSKHTIRYYEKEGFIQPHRDENGYRDYRDEDVQTLKLVKFLRSLEISIDDVKAILSGDLNFQECLKITGLARLIAFFLAPKFQPHHTVHATLDQNT